MHSKTLLPYSIFIVVLTILLLSACSSSAAPAIPATVPATLVHTAVPTIVATSLAHTAVPTIVATSLAHTAVPSVVPTPSKPDWFSIPLTDVRTDKTFTINDFAGKVVLVQTMVQWCPSCAYQQMEVTKLFTLLDDPENLVPISLDVDPNEDQASLKKYADQNGFDWHFAVAPLGVERALGNLYSVEYLNGPLDPMLFIDRSGSVYGLPYGLKSAGALKITLAPYLQQ